MPENPPIEKDEYVAMTSGFMELIVLITALKSAFTATPERIREMDESTLLVNKEIENTITRAKVEPMKANAGNRAKRDGKKERNSRTAAPAPEFTPIIFGLERAFPVAFWIKSPETENASPERMEANTLGRRKEKKMMLSRLPGVRIFALSIGTLPTNKERRRTAKRAKAERKQGIKNLLAIKHLFHHLI